MRIEEKNRLAVYVAISVMIHACLFVVLVVLGGAAVLTRWLTVEPPPPRQLTPEMVLLQTRPPQPQQFLETDASQETQEKPKPTPFYSDRNTVAADQSSKSGQDRPEIKGREKDTLATADVVLSKLSPPQPPSPAKPPVPEEKPKPQQPQPAEKNAPSDDVAKKQLAMLKPNAVEARPVNPEEVPVEAQQVRPEEMASPENARAPPSMPPQRAIPTRASSLTGGIGRNGVISFDTQASPAGRYDKILIQTISQRWYLLVGERYRNQAGTVRVEFELRADGQISNLTVAPDEGVGPLLANMCREAILDSVPFRPFPSNLQPIWGDSRKIKIFFQYSY